jgi:peptide deformylase
MGKNILVLGNPVLREQCKIISDFDSKAFLEEINELKIALDTFRENYGFGRGIAAIQIGILKRIIALNLGHGTFVIVNPLITRKSSETFTLWDDCMSFPDLVVRVKRYKTINLEYQDEIGKKKEWNNLGEAESELLQHEIDHLDGVMAIDRAIGKKDILYKTEFNKNKEYYESKVDYSIKTTVS